MPELEREAVTHPLESVQRFAQEGKAGGTNGVIAPRPAAPDGAGSPVRDET